MHDLTERRNPLFTWFAKTLSDRYVIMGSQDDDPLPEARKGFKELYKHATSALHSYITADPEDIKYEIGKGMQEAAYPPTLAKS